MSEIKTLKMTSGEEVIGRVEHDEDGETYISSPLVIQIMQLPQGGFGLGLIPWVHSSKTQRVQLNFAQVMAQVDPDKDIQDEYISQTSGIKIASAGLLQG